ncbi:MAG: deoxyguanosinetriphosphate triphosphohydrolase [Planctomycetota bacterium]
MVKTREDKERIERELLAPYALKSEDSVGRRHAEADDPFRTAFERDRDRVVHSSAFRRLEYKTQVFVNHEGDYYRTRLTHTMEVAQISRSVASTLGLNETFVEALSLAHDLGHTPFGHAGGEALHEMMRDHGGFEHNLHGVRVVDHLERRYPGFPGLNLTAELREAIVKHPVPRERHPVAEAHPDWRPLLETQVVDVCDRIAYNNHDLDDGVTSGLIDFTDLRSHVSIVADAHAAITARLGDDADPRLELLETVNRLIKLSIADLVESSEARLVAAGVSSSAEARTYESTLIGFSDAMAARQRELHEYLFKRMYRHPRVVRMAEKAKRFVREIFREYVRHPGQLEARRAARLETDGVEQVVCDYIASLTDREAQDEYKKLFHPFERI